MKTIKITTQQELDALPDSFAEYTVIRIESANKIILSKLWENSTAVLRGNSTAELWGNSTAELWGNSTAELWENSTAELWGNSTAVLRGNSTAVLRGNSTAELWGNSTAELWGNSTAELWGNSTAVLRGNSTAVLRGNSTAVLRGNSTAVLRGNSTAELWENSTAELWENSKAELWGNSTAVLRGNSTAELWENSTCYSYGQSQVVAYMFAVVFVFSEFVKIKKLLDRATLKISGNFEINPEESHETATIIKNDVKLTFEQYLQRGYVYADGIFSKFISKKQIGEAVVFECERNFKKEYVVKINDVFAHGENVASAMADIRLKFNTNRDTSHYKKWATTDAVSLEEMITAYRMITGACRLGVDSFLFSLKEKKESYSVQEVIDLTKNQYGNEIFKKFNWKE
jgi:hypothetical protein